MSAAAIEVKLPRGRIVQGDLYKAQDKDANGAPLTIKTPGPKFGQPTIRFFFAVAVPKSPGATHWANEPWATAVWNLGHSSWPNGQAQAPTFAWKIEDGDSTVPNKRGRLNSKTEGMPGCWIISLSSNYAPKIFDSQLNPLVTDGAVKRGYYVECAATVKSNENAQNPGIYINHSLVVFRDYGPEITSGPDPRALFTPGALPVPQNGAPPVPGAGGAPPAPAPAAGGAPPPHAAAPAVPPPATAVAPHAGYMVPPVPGQAAAPPPPAAPTWKGPAGTTQAQYAAAGWTEAQMRASGLLA